ncbi:MAG: hypothetical protein ACK2T3_12150 [Candidatus Promineifilaceae bacterium]
MSERMDRIVKDTQRYLYDDGLVEIATGLLVLLVGLGLFSWMAFTDISSVLGVVLIVTLLLLAVVGGYLIKKAVEAVKERITYPRTGYVAYKQEEPRRGRLIVMAAALLASLVILLLPEELSRMCTIVGAMLGIVLVILGYRLAITRFYVVGFVAIAAGLVMSYLFEEEALGTAVTLMISGAALILSGAAALMQYLQKHPEIDEGIS